MDNKLETLSNLFDGNDVGYDKRLEDIKNRYGDKSEIYMNCCKLVDKIRAMET